jgi:hypothetical protein
MQTKLKSTIGKLNFKLTINEKEDRITERIKN